MRGVPARLPACAAALVVVSLLAPASAAAALVPAVTDDATAPGLGATDLPSGPGTGADCADECRYGPRIGALLREAPVDDLPRLLIAALGPLPADAPPAPHQVPGYDALEADLQRDLWRVWTAGTGMRAALPFAPFGTGVMGADGADASSAASPDDALDEPFGVRELWRVESHGAPLYVVPAGDAGETFLVTSLGVLRFAAPGAAPDWMVKPGGYIGRVDAADANDDGVLDLVIGSYTFRATDDASLLVVDGSDGSVLFRGMGGEDRYLTWTLTDVDGDGVQEVLGLTGMLEIVAIELDGTEVYRTQLLDMPSHHVSGLLLGYVYLYYDSHLGSMFGDVNGDGVEDIFVSAQLYAWVVTVVASYMIVDPAVTTYSGVDGTVIWTAPGTPAFGSHFVWPMGTGDLDGDGADDLLLFRFEYSSVAGVFHFASGYDVISGRDGHYLVRDDTKLTCAMYVCLPGELVSGSRSPIAFADLDRDGAEELLTVELTTTGEHVQSLELVARAAAPTGHIGSLELYRHTLALPGVSLLEDGFRLRDVNQDGLDELLVYLVGFDTDEAGNVTAVATAVSAVGPDGVTSFATPRLVGNYDIDPATGQAYAWTLPEDRWVPVDDDGVAVGRGLRMVLSVHPVVIEEHTGDSVPDVLLHKAIGFTWVDGRTGKLLEDVERPPSRSAVAVLKEAGELRVLERSYATNRVYLASLETGKDLWSFSSDHLAYSWVFDYTDVTGDGLADLATIRGECAETCWDEIRVYDMTTKKRILTERTDAWQARFGDAVLDRPGDELLLVEQDENYAQTLRVLAPELDAPLWTYPLGSDGHVSHVQDGTVLVRVFGEGLTLEFVDGATGEQVAAFATEAESWDTGILLHDIDGDPSAEAVVSYVVRNDRGHVTGQRVVVLDADTAEELSSFELSEPDVVRVAFGGGVYDVHQPAFVAVAAGDWNRDGLVDFAYREQGHPVVRSTADGEPLAVAPMRGTPVVQHDLNRDGVPELGVVSDYGALRFLAKAGQPLALDREEAVQVVRDPEATQEGSGTDFFVEESSSSGVALVALSLVGLAFVLRRRR